MRRCWNYIARYGNRSAIERGRVEDCHYMRPGEFVDFRIWRRRRGDDLRHKNKVTEV